MNSLQTLCILPNVHGVGGMVSFREKLEAGLRARGVTVSADVRRCDALLVIAGTRRLDVLWQARRRGTPVIQRLDGMNWVHRRRKTGWRHFLRAEMNNAILSAIRARLASGVVYQSRFVESWWERVYGPTRAAKIVIYNGVDLTRYHPAGEHERPANVYRLLLVEASLGGGYEMGLESAVRLAETLQNDHQLPVELMVVGRVTPALQAEWSRRSRAPIRWAGLAARGQIPALARSAHVLFSADLHGACPNAVVEALACGLPVVTFDTGALGELVTGDAGRVVAYGGNPWNIEPPDIPGLARAAAEILANQPRFRAAARARAEATFGLDAMVDAYAAFISGDHRPPHP